jgi:hypothetical protein
MVRESIVLKTRKGEKVLLDEEDLGLLFGKRKILSPYVDKWGYARVDTTKDSRRVSKKIHRLVMGAIKGQIVDHVNGNKLDNRRVNLRFVNHSLNRANSISYSKHKYKGVSAHGKKWRARFSTSSFRKDLGFYTDILEAALAYDLFAINYYGQNKVRLNIIS